MTTLSAGAVAVDFVLGELADGIKSKLSRICRGEEAGYDFPALPQGKDFVGHPNAPNGPAD